MKYKILLIIGVIFVGTAVYFFLGNEKVQESGPNTQVSNTPIVDVDELFGKSLVSAVEIIGSPYNNLNSVRFGETTSGESEIIEDEAVWLNHMDMSVPPHIAGTQFVRPGYTLRVSRITKDDVIFGVSLSFALEHDDFKISRNNALNLLGVDPLSLDGDKWINTSNGDFNADVFYDSSKYERIIVFYDKKSDNVQSIGIYPANKRELLRKLDETYTYQEILQ